MSDSIQVGTVRRFNPSRGYGFILPEGAEDHETNNVFVHKSDIPTREDIDRDYPTLYTDEKVEYEIEETDKGIKAVNVKVIEAKAPPPRQTRRHQRRPYNKNNYHPKPRTRGTVTDVAVLSRELEDVREKFNRLLEVVSDDKFYDDGGGLLDEQDIHYITSGEHSD